MATSTWSLAVHDLKNALGILEAQLEQLALQPTPEAAHRAHAHCADLRSRFVQYLTVYGRDEALMARCEDEAPLDILESLLHDHQRWRDAACDHPIDVRIVDADQAPALCFVDAHLVRLALEAALHNALRFARSEVRLSAWADQGGVRFRVKDDGPGLGAVEDGPRSTGLGTALCEAVAQAHRLGERSGQVCLVNAPEGGALFELVLP